MGNKGARVNAIVEELKGEKIDIIPYLVFTVKHFFDYGLYRKEVNCTPVGIKFNFDRAYCAGILFFAGCILFSMGGMIIEFIALVAEGTATNALAPDPQTADQEKNHCVNQYNL